MRDWRTSLVVCVCLSCIFCAGCIEYTEDLWLYSDGSARLKLDLGISEVLLALGSQKEDPLNEWRRNYEQTKKEILADQNVEDFQFQEYSDEATHHFIFDLTIKDVQYVNDVQRKALGEMSTETESFVQDSLLEIRRLENGNFFFSKTLDFKPIKQGKLEESENTRDGWEALGKAWAYSLFADKYMTIRLYGSRVVSTNGRHYGAQGFTEWKFSLVEFMKPGQFFRKLDAEVVPVER